MRWLSLQIIFVFLFPGICFSGIITVCGASKGYSYFFKNPITDAEVGWAEDGISEGQIILALEGNGKELNLYYKDTLTMRSPKEEGGRVHLLYTDQEGNTFLILVEYPGNGLVEHYLFKLDGSGKGKVAWGTVRDSVKGVELAPKSSLFVANCSKSNQ